MAKSIEQDVERKAKNILESDGIKVYDANASMGEDIDVALKSAESKKGGKGGNNVDIRCKLELQGRCIPIMIEVKGIKGALIKYANDKSIELLDSAGEISKAVNAKAVNGAVHYANAIIKGCSKHNEVIAVGLNGYVDEIGKEQYEVMAYYIKKSAAQPILIFDNTKESDKYDISAALSFLYKRNWQSLIDRIDNLGKSEQEIEEETRIFEETFESNLKALNQRMNDIYMIDEGHRVQILAGLIMAGLSIETSMGTLSALNVSELKAAPFKGKTDADKIMGQINSFLELKHLPIEKLKLVTDKIESAFRANNGAYYTALLDDKGASTTDSKIGLMYKEVKDKIIPIFSDKFSVNIRLDLTGKLFNVLNDWVQVADNKKNDVVLTPRYVAELMVKLCEVNRESRVWDYAMGTGGFLVSAMKHMLKDAEDNIISPARLEEVKQSIKTKQLLGIELRDDMYVLAVLNMILMGDGSTNILQGDSLQYNGKYEQGEDKDKDFEADVFLLNPPYSAPGKGLIFVKAAFDKMKCGKGAVLIMESAGDGKGGKYAKSILQKNTLLASIHMPKDLFAGKSSVQTAIYLFQVGRPHRATDIVKFVDFSDDGYKRKSGKKRKKLENEDHAFERYQDVVDFVVNNKSVRDLQYLTEKECFEDKITLEGNDWNVVHHKSYDTVPTEEDFKRKVASYLSWRVSNALRGV